MNWLKENWFKLALVLTVPLTGIMLLYGLVIYPENIKQQEQSILEERRSAAKLTEKAEEQQRKEDLQSCLKQNEIRRSFDHLALCGDSQFGGAPAACMDVYGGAKDFGEVADRYHEVFSNAAVESGSAEAYISEVLEYEKVCNCGLSASARDDLDSLRERRDQECLLLFGE